MVIKFDVLYKNLRQQRASLKNYDSFELILVKHSSIIEASYIIEGLSDHLKMCYRFFKSST